MESNRINRRDFLRIAGVGAAGMVIVACAPAAPAAPPPAPKRRLQAARVQLRRPRGQ